MKQKILVPDIGDFGDVEIIEVLVGNGDNINKEQSLITLESDKATMDVPSPVAGVLTAVWVKAGDKVSEGSHIADVELAEVADGKKTTMPTETEEQTATVESPTAASEQPPPATAKTSDTTVVDVQVPDIGDFESVEIIEVLIGNGDNINKEQSLITLESDKATMDVPSPVAGLVRQIHVKAGDKVSEGALIVTVASGEAPANTTPPSPVETPPSPQTPLALPNTTTTPPTSVSPTPTTGKPYAGPAVRRFARELGVNLTQVNGSGKHGRILKEDVQQKIKSTMQSGGGNAGNDGLGALLNMPDVDFQRFGAADMQPLSRINKLSAKNLHRNWLVAPHVTQFGEADVTNMEEFRQSMTEEAKKNGYKMTPLTFLIKAAVASLRQFPRFNASLQASGENLALKQYFHIGVAVDTANGLVVPVLRDADKKGLIDIARELADISARARDGKLKKEDMEGGCFTISSLGGIGGGHFTPILNLPEAAILGVSRAEIKPHWDGEKFVPRRRLPLSLSYDHRIIDGAGGARFITYYADLLSDIRRLIL